MRRPLAGWTAVRSVVVAGEAGGALAEGGKDDVDVSLLSRQCLFKNVGPIDFRG